MKNVGAKNISKPRHVSITLSRNKYIMYAFIDCTAFLLNPMSNIFLVYHNEVFCKVRCSPGTSNTA